MKNSGTNQRKLIIFSTLLIFGALAAAVYFFTSRSQTPTMKSWIGNWEVVYYYENEPNILYNGILSFENPSDMNGTLSLNLPRSSKKPKMSFEIQSVSSWPFVMTAIITHESFMIGGGHPREQIELRLDSPKTVSGNGECLEYCAPGTEGKAIIWAGNKLE